jgi:hypothetical protein
MERLSAEDQLMLWPDAIWPQDIGALAVLDGSDLLGPDGGVRCWGCSPTGPGRRGGVASRHRATATGHIGASTKPGAVRAEGPGAR